MVGASSAAWTTARSRAGRGRRPCGRRAAAARRDATSRACAGGRAAAAPAGRSRRGARAGVASPRSIDSSAKPPNTPRRPRRRPTETGRSGPSLSSRPCRCETRSPTRRRCGPSSAASRSAVVVSKIADRLNDLTRQFIERAPFVCLATSAPDGSCDVSPRGDPAGFVRILDERTLLLPDRPGNRIADSLRNILVNPHVGLLFVIPGIGDSFRVNGRAIADRRRRAARAVGGRRQGAEARHRRRDRRGLHAVLEGVHPLRPVEPGAAHRPAGAAERGRDPEARCGTTSSTPTTYNAARAARYARGEGLY